METAKGPSYICDMFKSKPYIRVYRMMQGEIIHTRPLSTTQMLYHLYYGGNTNIFLRAIRNYKFYLYPAVIYAGYKRIIFNSVLELLQN